MPDLAHVFMGLQETPTPTQTVDPDLVTPGPLGFGVIALLVVAVIVLVISMLGRVRRTRYRGEVREMLDEEERARDATSETDAGDGSSAPADEKPSDGEGPTPDR